jgi:hypothetical protein
MRVFEWNAQVSWKEPDVNSYEGKRCLVRLFCECPIPIYREKKKKKRERRIWMEHLHGILDEFFC